MAVRRQPAPVRDESLRSVVRRLGDLMMGDLTVNHFMAIAVTIPAQ